MEAETGTDGVNNSKLSKKCKKIVTNCNFIEV